MQKKSQKPPGRKLTAAEYVAKRKEMRAAEARESFYWFRRLIRPQMLTGWWTDCIESELQIFYEDFMAGRRPKLAMMAPPQHGKSSAATDFTAWVAGKNPDLKTIFASYSDELGVRTNLDLQRILRSPNFQLAFPQTQIDQHGWICNAELIEYVGHTGSVRNTTVKGAINGMELHLGVIDDPVKGRQEAHSKAERDRTWNWFTDDFLPRFSKNSAMLIIMTRWHMDDLLGRYIDVFKGIRVLPYPAIAEKDTQYRNAGAPLFPELKPLEFLEEQRKILSDASWRALYQQHPIVVGGGVIPVEKLRLLPVFDRSQVNRSVRFIDKAGTPGGGAFTACVLMHEMLDKTYVISHIARGQWGALEREQKIKILVDADAKLFNNYEVGIEQEPGSGGKESAEATVRNLAGKRVFTDRVTGSKETRAEPFVAQCQNDNVRLVAGDWVETFLDEAEGWPASKYKDQIDACAGAFNRLTKGHGYDTSYAGFV
jgi:predicted phage terminase large subunit-like protein